VRWECSEEGCDKSVKNGDTLYRVSPKGLPFEGKCLEHYAGIANPIKADADEN